MRFRSWLPIIALAAAAAPSEAANPKLAIRVENATLPEAVKRLTEASGIPVSMYETPRVQGAVAPGAERDAKATFDWNGVTFAKALRQLCDKFMLQPNRTASGYMLYQSFQPPPGPPLKRVGLVEKNGYRLFVRGVGMNEYRRVDFTGGNGGNGGGNLSVDLTCELGDGDAELVAGIANVQARDDQGHVLVNQGQPNYYGYYGGMYPDEWQGNISVPAPHPKAKKLEWVSGDFMAYRSVKPLKAEIPLPLGAKVVRRDIGDLIIAVSRFRTVKQEAEDDDNVEGLPNPRQGAQPAAGPSVRVRVYSPQAGSRIGSRQGGGVWNLQPYLVGSTGKTYFSNRTNSSGWGDGQMTVNDSIFTFPNVDDSPVKLVWDLVERSEPVRLFSFRMTDIPLPPPNVPLPNRNPGPGAPPADLLNRPFYEKGGGTLISRIQVQGKPAGEGTLEFGLAERVGAGWGPVRWMEVEAVDGVAKLEEVKPGSYRLLRKYHAKDPGALPAGGKWLNAEAVVTVAAGKEQSLALLQWGTGAPVGGAVKPPVKVLKPK